VATQHLLGAKVSPQWNLVSVFRDCVVSLLLSQWPEPFDLARVHVDHGAQRFACRLIDRLCLDAR
jgi:hypothetical protein